MLLGLSIYVYLNRVITLLKLLKVKCYNIFFVCKNFYFWNKKNLFYVLLQSLLSPDDEVMAVVEDWAEAPEIKKNIGIYIDEIKVQLMSYRWNTSCWT